MRPWEEVQAQLRDYGFSPGDPDWQNTEREYFHESLQGLHGPERTARYAEITGRPAEPTDLVASAKEGFRHSTLGRVAQKTGLMSPDEEYIPTGFQENVAAGAGGMAGSPLALAGAAAGGPAGMGLGFAGEELVRGGLEGKRFEDSLGSAAKAGALGVAAGALGPVVRGASPGIAREIAALAAEAGTFGYGGQALEEAPEALQPGANIPAILERIGRKGTQGTAQNFALMAGGRLLRGMKGRVRPEEISTSTQIAPPRPEMPATVRPPSTEATAPITTQPTDAGSAQPSPSESVVEMMDLPGGTGRMAFQGSKAEYERIKRLLSPEETAAPANEPETMATGAGQGSTDPGLTENVPPGVASPGADAPTNESATLPMGVGAGSTPPQEHSGPILTAPQVEDVFKVPPPVAEQEGLVEPLPQAPGQDPKYLVSPRAADIARATREATLARAQYPQDPLDLLDPLRQGPLGGRTPRPTEAPPAQAEGGGLAPGMVRLWRGQVKRGGKGFDQNPPFVGGGGAGPDFGAQFFATDPKFAAQYAANARANGQDAELVHVDLTPDEWVEAQTAAREGGLGPGEYQLTPDALARAQVTPEPVTAPPAPPPTQEVVPPLLEAPTPPQAPPRGSLVPRPDEPFAWEATRTDRKPSKAPTGRTEDNLLEAIQDNLRIAQTGKYPGGQDAPHDIIESAKASAERYMAELESMRSLPWEINQVISGEAQAWLRPPPEEGTVPTKGERAMAKSDLRDIAERHDMGYFRGQDGTEVLYNPLFLSHEHLQALDAQGKLSEIVNGEGTSPKPLDATQAVTVRSPQGDEVRTVLTKTPKQTKSAIEAQPAGAHVEVKPADEAVPAILQERMGRKIAQARRAATGPGREQPRRPDTHAGESPLPGPVDLPQSKGHVGFAKDQEFFRRDDGSVYRVPTGNPIDPATGVREGARFFSTKTASEGLLRRAGVDLGEKTSPASPEPAGATQEEGPLPGYVRLYRAESTSTEKPPTWVQEHAALTKQDQAYGRWFTTDTEALKWYQNDKAPSRVTYVDVPKNVADASLVVNNPDAAKFSRDPTNEYFLPKEIADRRRPISGELTPTPSHLTAEVNKPPKVPLIAPSGVGPFETGDPKLSALGTGTTGRQYAMSAEGGVYSRGDTDLQWKFLTSRSVWEKSGRGKVFPADQQEPIKALEKRARRVGQEGQLFPRYNKKTIRYQAADPKIEAAFKKGEVKLSPKERLKQWADHWKDWGWNAFGEWFVPEHRFTKMPEFRNSLRLIKDAPGDAHAFATQQLGHILGGLDKGERAGEYELFRRVVVLQNWFEDAAQGRQVPGGFTGDQLKAEIEHLSSVATPEVLDALNRHKTAMYDLAKEDIQRGKMSPAVLLRGTYYPHHIVEVSNILTEIAPFLPKELKEPYRAWTRKRGGAIGEVDLNYHKVMGSHMYRVKLANAVDDFAQKWLTKLDRLHSMTEAEKAAAFGVGEDGKPNRPRTTSGAIYEIDGARHAMYQYRPYQWQVLVPESTVDAAALDTFERDYATDVAKQRAYLVPEDVAKRLTLFTRAKDVSLLEEAFRRRVTGWKRLAIDFAGIPFRIHNSIGDEAQWFIDDLPQALSQLDVRLWPKVHQLAKGDTPKGMEEIRRIIDEQRITSGATFFGGSAEHYHLWQQKPLSQKLQHALDGMLSHAEYWSSYAEAWPRVFKTIRDYEKLQQGKPLTSSLVKLPGELPPEAKLGLLNRELFVDYRNVPERFRGPLLGTTFPFLTWYAKMFARYSALPFKHPMTATLKIGLPLFGMFAWNNYGQWKHENIRNGEALQPSWIDHYPFHLTTPFKDEDGNRYTMVFTLGPETAMGIWQVSKLMRNLGQLARKEIGPEDLFKDIGTSEWVWDILKQAEDLSPPIQWAKALVTNKDPQTGQPIVNPPDQVGTKNDIPMRAKWLAKQAIPVIGRVMDTMRRDALKPPGFAKKLLGNSLPARIAEGIINGPLTLDPRQWVGYYTDPLGAAESKLGDIEHHAEIARAEGLYDLEQALGESADQKSAQPFTDVLKGLAEKGAPISEDDITNRFASKNALPFLRRFLEQRLSKATDPAEAERLRKALRGTIYVSRAKALQQAPKSARTAMILEMLKQKTRQGGQHGNPE